MENSSFKKISKNAKNKSQILPKIYKKMKNSKNFNNIHLKEKLKNQEKTKV